VTGASQQFPRQDDKRELLLRAMSEALRKRLSLLYLDLIMKPVPEDLKDLLLKLDFSERSNKPH
jgi:hypothetical protein